MSRKNWVESRIPSEPEATQLRWVPRRGKHPHWRSGSDGIRFDLHYNRAHRRRRRTANPNAVTTQASASEPGSGTADGV